MRVVLFLWEGEAGEAGSRGEASPTETRVPEEAKVSRRKEVRRSATARQGGRGGEGCSTVRPLKKLRPTGETAGGEQSEGQRRTLVEEEEKWEEEMWLIFQNKCFRALLILINDA